MPMLEVENLNSYYVKIHALKDVSITVEKGEVVTIIGAKIGRASCRERVYRLV